MDTFVTLITFSYPAEAYPLRSLLESEGIACYLKDEINVQMNPLASNAIGGVKLQVKSSDLSIAKDLLLKNGYALEKEVKMPAFWSNFEEITNRVPFMNNMPLVYRFLMFAAIIISIFVCLILWIDAS